MESQSNAEFTPPCPVCGHDRGRATTVTIHHRERTVTYVCRACDETWTATDSLTQESSGLWEEPPPPLKLI